jgi:ring-1,2-phenylacetyl-CoA epoxidase subunit PaaC
MTNQLRLLYTLQIADNALVIGHRMSEWCGHGPILEQDIAITNIALDHLGQARSLYQYAAQLFNALPEAEKRNVFISPAILSLVNANAVIDEDDLAYLRDGWDFRNALITEQPNKDWAYTVARSFYYDCYNYFFYTQLLSSNDETLAAVAEKSLKEVTYHLRWSSEWIVRLGDGTDESHTRMQAAINGMWAYAGELTTMTDVDKTAVAAGIGVNLETIKTSWKERVAAIIQEATLTLPTDTWMHEGGKEGRHSEHLGYILTELQFMQRAYPGMEW